MRQFLNNIVQDNIAGLFLANSSPSDQAVIEQNLFQNNDNTGAAQGTGIYADQYTAGSNLQNVLIANNTFTNTSFVEDSWGVGISNTGDTPFTDITVSGNTFSNAGRGMYFFNASDVNIEANIITGATHYGIGLFGTVDTDFTIAGNTIGGDPANPNNNGIYVSAETTANVDISGLLIKTTSSRIVPTTASTSMTRPQPRAQFSLMQTPSWAIPMPASRTTALWPLTPPATGGAALTAQPRHRTRMPMHSGLRRATRRSATRLSPRG